MLPRGRNIYDRLSEKRIADEARQRALQASMPKGDFASICFDLINAWVWVPSGTFDTPLPASELAQRRGSFDHDPRLLDSRALRQPIRRLETPEVRAPAVDASGRAVEILKAVFTQWSSPFYATVDWPATQVVLFAPTAISAVDWLTSACRLWPRDHLPHHGFDVQIRPAAQWIPEVLAQSFGAEYLLCLSLDTWACTEQVNACAPGEMVGEAVSAVLLRRRSKRHETQAAKALKLFTPIKVDHAPRASQARTDTQSLEQLMSQLREQTSIDSQRVTVLVGDGAFDDQRLSQLLEYGKAALPGLDLDQQIRLSTLSARVGPATSQWLQIGLAWLAVRAESGCAAWVLDRSGADQTLGWLIG